MNREMQSTTPRVYPATAALGEEIQKELKKSDPPKEKALAILKGTDEDTEGDDGERSSSSNPEGV